MAASTRRRFARLRWKRTSPTGGTIQGYGVKFNPPGHKMAGQNERSSPVVMMYVGGQTKVVWPAAIKTADPVMPLPKGHAYAR